MNSAQPVFVFASSWRSGSTLVQRYITSTGNTLIWGETGGALNSIAESIAGWQQITADSKQRFAGGLGGKGEATFHKFITCTKQEQAQQWIANLSPPFNELLAGLRTLFDTIYAEHAQKLWYPNWGIKETRCDLNTAIQLQRLFPQARFVFLVRNPFDVILSVKRRDWLGKDNSHATLKYFATHWLTRAEQFRQANFGLTLRYEDFVSNPLQQQKLLSFLEIAAPPPKNFIQNSKVDWQTKDCSELSTWERARLRYWLGAEMKNWHYL